MAPGRGGGMRKVDAGIDGQADLSGLIGPGGRRCEVECKADYSRGRDRQSPVQEAFQRRIEAHGGIYFLADHIRWGPDGKPDVSEVMEKLKTI